MVTLFPYTTLFRSSHDHQFVSTIANRIVEILPGGVIDRMMPFDDYLADEKVIQLRQELS